ncbi:MAG: hypothetical protein MK161_13440 [Pirellulales bacterium]|nr:hypothetical protein [Pirellulales bacterium]
MFHTVLFIIVVNSEDSKELKLKAIILPGCDPTPPRSVQQQQPLVLTD